MYDQVPTYASASQLAHQLPYNNTTEQSQDLTSNPPPLISLINTNFTDEEILHGNPKLITKDRILQVSATHTAEEIASTVNTGRYPDILTPKLVYHRIHTACRSVAARNNTTFEMVKAALNQARVESGVKARINATLGRGISAGAGTDAGSQGVRQETEQDVKQDTKQDIKHVSKHSSDSSLTSLDDSKPTNYLGDFFSLNSQLGAVNPLFKRISKGGCKLPENEDILLLASRHTVAEIVEMVQAEEALTGITASRVSARIMEALTLIGTTRLLPREVVKREFEAAKNANGVVARHYEKISTKRKAGTQARRAAKAQRVDSVVRIESPPKGPFKKSLLLKIAIKQEQGPDSMEWTPTPGLEENMAGSETSDDTAPWLDSPRFAKYKLTPDSDLYSADAKMGEECLTREEAARILLEMRAPLTEEEDAALILLQMRGA